LHFVDAAHEFILYFIIVDDVCVPYELIIYSGFFSGNENAKEKIPTSSTLNMIFVKKKIYAQKRNKSKAVKKKLRLVEIGGIKFQLLT
jgi:hypothetical protein